MQALPESGVVDLAGNNSYMVNAGGLREPDMVYTLPQALMTRDYLCMYITLAGNR